MSLPVDSLPPRLAGLPPVADARTRLVVLGSFPSAASLAAGEYYAHPRNQLWPLLSALWARDLRAMPYAERLRVMLQRRVGLWDVFAACRREGSLDSAIAEASLNDLTALHTLAPHLQAVVHNGAASARAVRASAALDVATARLPSTSPAHAAWSFERKLAAWRAVFQQHGVA